jgi:hypothetical protein
MLACILFVFAALAEYAALLYHRTRVVFRATAPPPTRYKVCSIFSGIEKDSLMRYFVTFGTVIFF